MVFSCGVLMSKIECVFMLLYFRLESMLLDMHQDNLQENQSLTLDWEFLDKSKTDSGSKQSKNRTVPLMKGQKY